MTKLIRVNFKRRQVYPKPSPPSSGDHTTLCLYEGCIWQLEPEPEQRIVDTGTELSGILLCYQLRDRLQERADEDWHALIIASHLQAGKMARLPMGGEGEFALPQPAPEPFSIGYLLGNEGINALLATEYRTDLPFSYYVPRERIVDHR